MDFDLNSNPSIDKIGNPNYKSSNNDAVTTQPTREAALIEHIYPIFKNNANAMRKGNQISMPVFGDKGSLFITADFPQGTTIEYQTNLEVTAEKADVI